MIEFILDTEPVQLEDCDADITVLEYLREQRGLVGTKEGCASGDCGACTVVVAEAADHDNSLRYRAINSCITFLGALHGKQLITVEHLASSGELHPVQQAMVDQHGSQCGFCTPGFIMSMYALYESVHDTHAKDTAEVSRVRVEHSLSGNLCRCTGYRPIVDAALHAINVSESVVKDDSRRLIAEQLAKIPQAGKQGTANFSIPRSIDELAECYAATTASRLLAGGTDLALEVTQQLKPIEQIIYLQQVAELNEVHRGGGQIEIGAAVTLERCAEMFSSCYPEISKMLLRFGSVQIRNQGTIGGNLANASPIGDLAPVLLALNASLNLRQGQSSRCISLDRFFTGYRQTVLQAGEFIQSVVLPEPVQGQIFQVYKITKRMDDDISAVCLAISIQTERGDNTQFQITDARVAMGGMAATPARATHCENAFMGSPLNAETIARCQRAIEKDFSPISDARASAGYRIQVTKNLLQRFLLDASGSGVVTRVEDVC